MAEIGSYSPAFFKMTVNVDGDIDLNLMSPKEISVKSKFSTNNFKKIRIPQFSETRFGSFVGLFLVYKQ